MNITSVKSTDFSNSRLFLIGLPGAGKSSIGRKLSNFLGFQFIDVDREIERQTGVDLGWLLDVEGEAGLWKREQQLLERIATLDKVVFATSGSASLSQFAIEQLPKLGIVILLEVELEAQLQRLKIEAHRPFLHRLNTIERTQTLQQMTKERSAIYRRLQALTFNTGQMSIAATAKQIAEMVVKRNIN